MAIIKRIRRKPVHTVVDILDNYIRTKLYSFNQKFEQRNPCLVDNVRKFIGSRVIDELDYLTDGVEMSLSNAMHSMCFLDGWRRKCLDQEHWY